MFRAHIHNARKHEVGGNVDVTFDFEDLFELYGLWFLLGRLIVAG